MTKSITPAQAHMLAMTRLLGRLTRDTAGVNGLRTARSLAKLGLVELSPPKARGKEWWYIEIPAAHLLIELGLSWVDRDKKFLRAGDRYYGVRTWHDGRRYILAQHPASKEQCTVFLGDLFPEEEV